MKPVTIASHVMPIALLFGACLDPIRPLTPEQYADLFADTADVSETLDASDTGDDTVDSAETAGDTVDTTDTSDDTLDTSTPDDGTTSEDVADTAADTTEVADTTADIADSVDVSDSADVVEVTDSADVVEVTDSVDASDVDVIAGCESDEALLSAACLPSAVPLHLFEPVHDGDAMGPPLGLVREHRAGGASTWARAAEPVEVALVNGSRDDDALVAWFPFDDDIDNAAPRGGYALTDGPPDRAPEFQAGGPGRGQALMVAPRYSGAVLAPGSGSLTLMGWFRIESGLPPTAAYDLFGYTADPMAEPELALGIADGHWSARLAGAEIPFAEVVGGAWQHVALTWQEGDEATGTALLYFDGAVAAVEQPALEVLATRFFVGALFPVEGGAALGAPPLADEVIVFERALDPAEVRAYAQMGRPLGEALVPEAQADFDDLRVVRDEEASVTREIIGRRPHGDSGAETEGVLGVWRLDEGSLSPSYARSGFGTSQEGITLGLETGAFGDPRGAIRATQPGPANIAMQRLAWGAAFTVELWLRVGTAEAGTACATDIDGATVLTAQSGDGGTEEGWLLRLCDGRLAFATSTASVTGATNIADGVWHHVMASYDGAEHRVIIDGALDGAASSSGTPADARLAVTLLHRPPGSGGGDPPRTGDVTIDDLVLHDVARPVGYATQRAWPRLPHVRFLVGTAGAGHGLPAYTLRAGNAEVAAPEINACGSLVSSCTGYVAWWRFDEARRGAVPDASAAALHLPLSGDWSWTTGLDGGLALVFDGATSALTLDPQGAFGLPEWTVELGVRPDATSAEATVIERPGTGTPPDVSLNYALRIAAGGFVQHHLKPVGIAAKIAQGAAVVAAAWTPIGGGYRADPRTLSVSVGAVETSVTPEAGPSPLTVGGPLFIGRGGRPDAPGWFGGGLDALRIMNRPPTEAGLLKYPPLSWRPL